MKKILKFGGSSLADASCIHQVSKIVEDQLQRGEQVFVVVSALRGVTDQIITISGLTHSEENASHQINELFKRHEKLLHDLNIHRDIETHQKLKVLEKQFQETISKYDPQLMDFIEWRDELLSFGERFSCVLLTANLNDRKVEAECLDAREVVLTDTHFGNAYVHYQKSYDRIRSHLDERAKLQVITGFLGATESGKTTTLGRSGSDYSASIFGAALNVDSIEIWTDVNGILTANPTLVNQVRPIPELTYEEAMELAHAGAKVIFPPTMIPALYKKIPILIKNTFNPEHPGTRISADHDSDGPLTVGLSSVSHVSLIRLQGAGMVGVRGINARLFTCLANGGISIMLVSQAFSEHSTCFALKPDETARAVDAIEVEFSHELRLKYIDRIRIEGDLSLVAVVGEGMQNTPGIAGTVFEVLGRANINVEAIAQGSSKRNISFIVKDEDVKTAIQALHDRLFG